MHILFLGLALLVSIVVQRVWAWWKHPLSRFPGPFSASFSNIHYSKDFFSGRQPYRQLALHEKYGPVVRVAPNELIFNTATSWRDIYGPRKGVDTLIKSDFYDGGSFAADAHTSLISERDPKKHAAMRKYLASSFSDRALRDQEPLVAEHVDHFIAKLGAAGMGTGPAGGNGAGTDMTMWFHLTTFDIIGSLAFGRDFGGVESGKDHFWISIVIKALRLGAFADWAKRFSLLASVAMSLFSKQIKNLLDENRRHQKYTMDLVQERLNKPSERRDFLTTIIEARQDAGITDYQIAAHTSDFVIAGSETTATTLSTMTYYLLKNPAVMNTLLREIRSSFAKYEDITAATAAPLPYLKATIQEALRMYPPVPFPLPRVVPEGGCTIDGYFVPGGTIVATSPLGACMSRSNFTDPTSFIPERWLKKSSVDRLDASQPFSYGSRSCIGRSLGWMELQTIMSKLLFRYDLELADTDLDWHADSSMNLLWEKPRLMVRVSPAKESEDEMKM